MSASLATKSRIEVIDVLRGFTLLGIAMVHFTEQYYAGQPPDTQRTFAVKDVADQIVSAFIGIFVQGKFFMIFSFLFGLSFFLQSDTQQSNSAFLSRFAWRLITLFAIGFVHHLHYRGDILTIYATLGFGLLLAYRLPDRALLWIALLLVFNIPSVFVRAYTGLTGGNVFPNPDQKDLQIYFDTLSTGSYLSILNANLKEFIFKMDFQIFSGRIYITMGLFLLGLYAGRKSFFTSAVNSITATRSLMRRALWVIGGCVVFAVTLFGGSFAAGITLPPYIQFSVGGLLYDVFNAALATVYVMGVLILFTKERWRNRLMSFYSAGRMGLTTYLGQTLVGFLVFFAPGLGMLGKFGALTCLVLGLVVFVAQCVVSQWWLSNFYYGPVEWLWRSLTYLKIQPFRKTTQRVAL